MTRPVSMPLTRPLPVLALCLVSGLVSAGCELTSPESYFPGAVVEGLVEDALAQPVPGLEVRVLIRRDECEGPERLVVPLDVEGPVLTGEDGGFSATWHFLFTGPVTVACTTVRVIDPEGDVVVADTTLTEPIQWTSPATETIRVELRLPADGGEDGGGDPDGGDEGTGDDGGEEGTGDDGGDGDDGGNGEV